MRKRKLVEYRAERYKGHRIDNHGCESGWQVVAFDPETGRRVCVWSTDKGGKTAVLKIGHVREDYTRGIAVKDKSRFDNYGAEAAKLAAEFNAIGAKKEAASE